MESSNRMTATHAGSLFLQHFRMLPRWHFGVLIAALIGTVIGTAGLARKAVTPSPAAQQNAIAPGKSETQSAHNGFVADASGQPVTTTLTPADDTPWYLSPHFLKIGGSTLGGYIVGWLIRTFVKTMTLALAGIAAIIGAASYFRLFNVDFSAAHQEFNTASAWLMNQTYLLKNVAIAHLPSHTGGAIGAYIGFKRR